MLPESLLALPPDLLGTLPLLALVGATAGFIDAIGGGGGLLTLPALLTVGLPPPVALATNKLQSSAGSISASRHYVRAGVVNLPELLPTMAVVLVGAGSGAWLVQHLQVDALQRLIPFLLAGAITYFALSPRLNAAAMSPQENAPATTTATTTGTGTTTPATPTTPTTPSRTVSPRIFALPAFALGFYDGFFGPGTGSFFILAFVSLRGLALRSAVGHARLLNMTSNVGALLVFVLGGQVAWAIAAVMAVGQACGARAGAGLVVRGNIRWIRPIIITVCTAMLIRLVWQDPEHPVHQATAHLLSLL